MEPSAETDLINFFSKYSVEEAESAGGKHTLVEIFGKPSWKELTHDTGYIHYCEPIKQLRQQLDDWIKGTSGIEQVQSCLALVHRNRKVEKTLDTLKKLIDNQSQDGLYTSWGQEQQEYYDTHYPVVADWNDVFFSYTRRTLPGTNNDFQNFISHEFDPTELSLNKNQRNYIFRSLHFLKYNCQ